MLFTTQAVLPARMEPGIRMFPEERHLILIHGIQLLCKPLQQPLGFCRVHILFVLLTQTDVLPAALQQFSIHLCVHSRSDVTRIILQAALPAQMELHIPTHPAGLRLILLAGVMGKPLQQQQGFYPEHTPYALPMRITALPAAQQLFPILPHAILQWPVTNITTQAVPPVLMEPGIRMHLTELHFILIRGAQILCKPLLLLPGFYPARIPCAPPMRIIARHAV